MRAVKVVALIGEVFNVVNGAQATSVPQQR
jgi:hypothetical protein